MTRVVAVTGAHGYVGRHIVSALSAAGWTVHPWTRTEHDLRTPAHVPDCRGLDALVICAWDFQVHGDAEELAVNVAGTRRLLASAAHAGVPRIVFVSTLSAFASTPSAYGHAKFLVERDVLTQGGVVVRPGLVWSHPPGGLVATLARLARWPVVPMVGGDALLWTCHADDLAAQIAHWLAATVVPDRPVRCAHAVPTTLPALIRRLAPRPVQILPVPMSLVAGPLRVAALLGMRLRVRADGLRGLVAVDPAPDFAPDDPTAPQFRPFAP